MVKRLPTIAQRAIAIMIALFMAVCLFTTTAYADDTGNAGNNGDVEYVTVGGDFPLMKLLRGFVNLELNGINSTSGLNSDIEKNAIMAPGSSLRQVWETNEDTLRSFYNIIFGVGVAMMIIYFLLHVQKEAIENRGSSDVYARACIILLAACWVMANGFDLLCYCIDIGSALGQEILNSEASIAVPTAAVSQDFIDNLNATSGKIWIVVSLVVAAIGLFLPYLGMNLMMLLIQVQVYMRMIELFMRAMFAPLALGDLFSGGPNPTGIRYFRAFLACALQGVIIIGTLFAYRMVSSGIASVDGALGVLGNIMILGAALGFIGKSNSFARELCGVG